MKTYISGTALEIQNPDMSNGDTCIVSKAYLESDGFCTITFVAVG